MDSISLQGPSKTVYLVGEAAPTAFEGLVVTAKYANGNEEAVTDYQVSTLDTATRGEKTVTVTYQTKTATFTVKVVQPGDVDDSGDVSANDALMALQASTGKITLTAAEALAADVDGIDQVTAADALLILQYSTQKIVQFPVDK